MMTTKQRIITTIVLFVTISALQTHALPLDPKNSSAVSSSGRIEIRPDGLGPTLASEGLTIEVTLRDALSNPVMGFPRADIWLAPAASATGVKLCSWRTIASSNTNFLGRTTIDGAIFGGGHGSNALQVIVAGVGPIDVPLAIDVVSPDMNADGIVDTTDLMMVPGGFAYFYLSGSYHEEVDYNCDGALNLLDITAFAAPWKIGAHCP